MFGTSDQLAALEKLQPAQLPVNTLSESHELYLVRLSLFYVYSINWIYNFKGYLRLTSEYFDVELFEMELLDLLNPPPLDPSVLFINKLKSQIIHALTNSNKLQYNDFDIVIKKSFINTPLAEDTLFDRLSLLDKFELLFTIFNYFSGLGNFRTFLEKTPELDMTLYSNILKTTIVKNKREDWLMLFNNTKIYKRTIEYPDMDVPKKRKDSPQDPEDFYYDKFDIDLASMTFSIELWSLDNFNEYTKKGPKSGIRLLHNKDFQLNVVQSEIKKRKIIQNRRKEYQMLNLMATRKKSSRLEARERQKQYEEDQEKDEKERQLKLAIELQHISQPLNYDSNNLTREDRLKLRKLNTGYRQDVKEDNSVEPEPKAPEPTAPEIVEVSVEVPEVAADKAPEIITEQAQQPTDYTK